MLSVSVPHVFSHIRLGEAEWDVLHMVTNTSECVSSAVSAFLDDELAGKTDRSGSSLTPSLISWSSFRD